MKLSHVLRRFRRWLQIPVLLTAIAGVADAATVHSFTLEQVLAAPFPSGLIAVGSSNTVAWVSNDHGARNVWIAQPGRTDGRAVTRFTGDDGVDLGELDGSSDGRTVAFTLGGSLEGGGPVNITSRPSGPIAQAVWLTFADGSAPRMVGPGHAAKISPKGDVVAYVQDGQVWIAALGGGAPTQLIHDRGRDDTLTWSPDGARLAFVSDRGDHSLIGVYDMAAKRIVWMSPSVDGDASPAWSPDGARLAYVRIAANQARPFADSREAQPWSLWVGDPATGAARAAWTASPGPGSAFRPLESDRTLFWAAGDRIIFPWERSGWLQLYALPLAGGAPARIGDDGNEVFSAAMSPDGRRLALSSNQGDVDHRHLWEVDAGSDRPRPLTSGATIEDSPVITGSGQVAALHGDWREPMRPVTIGQAGAVGALVAQATPLGFPGSAMVEPTPVVFDSIDGLKIYGQLFMPTKGKPAPRAAILFFHGGPTRQMLLGWHPMDAYTFMYGMNQYLADEGYIVLSVNYRGGTGYGLDFREAKHFGPAGGSELADIQGALRYLRGRSDVDSKRIGVWGGSYGGLMTALALARESDQVAAGVDYAGVHDWSRLAGDLGPHPDKAALDVAFQSSPMATVDKWTSPVLFVHADDDRNVPFDQTVELVEALRPRGVEIEQLVLPDEIHDLLRHDSWLRFFHAADDFLDRHLKP